MFKILLLIISAIVGQTYGRSVNTSDLSLANNDLYLRLLKQLSTDSPKKNVFISPFSISTAFSMLYTGARGVTADQMRRVLGYSGSELSDQQIKEQFQTILETIGDSNATELSIANRLLVHKNYNLLANFTDDVKTYFKSTVKSVDFIQEPIKTMNQLNQWITRQTRFKIKDVIKEPFDPLTRFVIVNAIYFKGMFDKMFDKNMTEEEKFFTADDTESKTQMMSRIGKFNYTEVTEIDSKLLEIPYSGDKTSLYVLLPNQRQGITDLMNNLNNFSIIDNAISDLGDVKITVSLPKFKIESSYKMKDTFIRLGMKAVFTEEADLSAITGSRELMASEIIHKAYVEVSEEGTEAAAVTAIPSVVNSAFPVIKPLTFRADHPFLFFIRDNTNGMVLFAGVVNNL